MDRFVFDFHQDVWTWRRVDARGKLLADCDHAFRYYLECLADARAHGFGGKPYFIAPNGEIVSPTFRSH